MSNKNDSLGDRMKTYEGVPRNFLTRRMPVIIRIDGKAFHTFTRGFEKPFDMILMECMWETCKYLCANIQGCKIAYTQSDEISLLLTDYETLTTSAWFDNNIQKMVSVSASMATLAFNKNFDEIVQNYGYKCCDESIGSNVNIGMENDYKRYVDIYFKRINSAMFDSRVFNIPKEEVCNYFVWRQKDATRNSIEAVGQANFSHKELNGKSCDKIQDMLFTEKNVNWNDFPVYQKRGACIVKEMYELDNETHAIRSRWVVDKNIPVFTQDRGYIEKFV